MFWGYLPWPDLARDDPGPVPAVLGNWGGSYGVV